MTTTPPSFVTFENKYLHRKSAKEGRCFICSKPTIHLLVSGENADWFYSCESHLQDRSFCSPEEKKQGTNTPEGSRVASPRLEKKAVKTGDDSKDSATGKPQTPPPATSAKQAAPEQPTPTPTPPQPKLYTLDSRIYFLRENEKKTKARMKERAGKMEQLKSARIFLTGIKSMNSSDAISPPETDLTQPTSSDSIFSKPSDLSTLQKLASIPSTFTASGFRYCQNLENSTFNSFVHIIPLGGSIAELNPPIKSFVAMIDAAAERMFEAMLEGHADIHPMSLKRASCYFAAQGNNHYMQLSTERMLVQISPVDYFQEVLPLITPTLPPPPPVNLNTPTPNLTVTDYFERINPPVPAPKPRRKYKLAYLLMVDGPTANLENIKTLVEELDDSSAVFLIHVDSHSKLLRDEISRWIALRDLTKSLTSPNSKVEKGNVFLTQTSYYGMWGHISLVWMQLNGFWELYDLADWEYVINLSAFDYPVRKSREIHRVLKKEGGGKRSYIEFWVESTPEYVERVVRPHLPHKDFRIKKHPGVFELDEVGYMYPPHSYWHLCKQSQWMILTREMVSELRKSQESMEHLAYAEFSWIPDESFFCQVLTNVPTYSQKVINSKKRFLYFYPKQAHPAILTMDWRHLFPEEEKGATPANFFLRKVDVKTKQGKELVEWLRKVHIEKHVEVEEGGET
ncbi:hypothetical protein HDV05_008278 [Chytridiales sp. JEL 0842]|nr:hypothetical protein HDV05_008278 [Chytridiales sp. JEL 0842]